MFRGDIGTWLPFYCLDQDNNPIDLTAATAAYIDIVRDGKRIRRDAVIATPPSAGIVEYYIVEGDLNEGDKNYLFQIIIDFSGGGHWNSSIVEEHVENTLADKYNEEPIP